jgi:hypothetical protein
VTLLVLYLQRGDRATFPDRYRVSLGGLETEFRFTAVRLWEHTVRIENGEFPELAPLLVLCQERPTEQTIQREIELIRGANFPANVQGDLFALAIRIAERNFPRAVLNRLFKEVEPMVKGSSFIADWIEEGVAQGVAQGMAQGMAQGEAQGETREARRLALHLLSRRFGALPEALVERIQAAEKEWCEQLLERAMGAETLAELEWER